MMDDEHTTDRRVKFDFEVDFSNRGGLQGQDFRLDIEGQEQRSAVERPSAVFQTVSPRTPVNRPSSRGPRHWVCKPGTASRNRGLRNTVNHG